MKTKPPINLNAHKRAGNLLGLNMGERNPDLLGFAMEQPIWDRMLGEIPYLTNDGRTFFQLDGETYQFSSCCRIDRPGPDEHVRGDNVWLCHSPAPEEDRSDVRINVLLRRVKDTCGICGGERYAHGKFPCDGKTIKMPYCTKCQTSAIAHARHFLGRVAKVAEARRAIAAVEGDHARLADYWRGYAEAIRG